MISAERSHLHVAAKSHPGMRRSNNEDRFAVSAFHLEGNPSLPVVFAIVSDGIGGHRAGEVAAEIAVETISQHVGASDASNPVQTLREAIIRSSQTIADQSKESPERKGMGATCACAYVIADRLYIANVGDSRIYLLRGGKISQLSTDHTWVQDAIAAGILTSEEAQGHPNAHVIRRFLGSQNDVEPDTRLRLSPGESDSQAEANQGLQLLSGDQIVLCSDGLTDLVSDSEILSILTSEEGQAATERLVELANQRGGHDNITVAALRVPASAAFPQPVSRPKRRWKITWLMAVLTILFGVIMLGGAYFFFIYPHTISSPASPSITPTQALVFPPGKTPSRTRLPSTPTPDITLTTSNTSVSATLTPWPTNPTP